MSSYTAILDLAGNARVDAVLRDDGALVLTGKAAFGADVFDTPDFADKDGLAYRAWLAAGGKLGDPVAATRPREATGYALVMALTDDQRALYGSLKPWDQRRLSLRGSDHIPEDNPLIARVATVLKTKPAAWFDAALGAGG